jgi:hypothetical protein
LYLVSVGLGVYGCIAYRDRKLSVSLCVFSCTASVCNHCTYKLQHAARAYLLPSTGLNRAAFYTCVALLSETIRDAETT